jgi:hypothetical protein
MIRSLTSLAFGLALAAIANTALAQVPASASSAPEATDGDFVIPSFRFHTAETLPALRIHYTHHLAELLKESTR